MARMARSRWARAPRTRIVAAVGMLVLPYVLLRIPAARAWTLDFIALVRTGGALGALALLGFDAVWALLAAPMWVMGAIAGYAYGFPRGVLVAVPVSLVAMCGSFLVGRLALSRVPGRGGTESPRVAAVRRALEADGLRIAMLLRVTPLLPQNFLTYVLASTTIRLRDFALATLLGLVPFTLFYVYVGSLVDDAAALLAGDAPDLGATRWVVLGAGLIAGATALVVIGRVARRALRRAMDAP
jgi:uncharacterized membrane protein YdjX (TVP38/TMEM64 family)